MGGCGDTGPSRQGRTDGRRSRHRSPGSARATTVTMSPSRFAIGISVTLGVTSIPIAEPRRSAERIEIGDAHAHAVLEIGQAQRVGSAGSAEPAHVF